MLRFEFHIVQSFIVIFSLIFFTNCKSPDLCPNNKIPGNLGQNINSSKNDFMPKVLDDTLYFLSDRDRAKSDFLPYYSGNTKSGFSFAKLLRNDLLNEYKITSTPVFLSNSDDKTISLLFSGIKKKSKTNSDVFLLNKGKTENLLSSFNTTEYESQPVISPDGSFIIFVADYPDAIGETDLYITFKDESGNWLKAVNMGTEINSKYQEITPFVANDGALYYSSNGFSKDNDFNIMKAPMTSPGHWKKPVVMKFPFNTEFDETSPFLNSDKMFFSSNRPGGCGGYDIYAFDLCGPIILTGRIAPVFKNIPLEGFIELYDENGDLNTKKFLSYKDSDFEFRLKPKEHYILKYKNDCFENIIYQKDIFAPCSDSSVVKIIANIDLLKTYDIFDFSNFNIPFFVSGYYLPNTSQNLNDLRLKFDYKLYGNADSLKYIEYPDEKYENYARITDRALDSAVIFITDLLKILQNNCDIVNKVEIKITGYSDPRKLSDAAKYNGESINDKFVDFYAAQGDNMTNELLSELRAYYIYLYLTKKLEIYSQTFTLNTKINWKIIGEGADESNKTNDKKRRVKLEIFLKDK